MLQQRQQNQVNQLQTQTTYGLGRSSSNKDFAKGVLKTRASQSKSSENNPFALRDRDLNKSNEKQQLKKDQSAKKVTLRVSSTNANQAKKTSKSPSVTRGNKHRVSVNQRSPATTSIQSSGKKTPCISVLTQQQSNYHNNSSTSVGLRKSAQNIAQNFEMNYDQIAEEDNDSSSFLAAEREANQVAHDDAHSQLSQNRIGAHLLANQDTYQYYPHHEAFRTPKPCRDAEIQSSNQSPLTSQRNNNIQRSSGMPLNRNDLLQMSQQTTLVNHGARITYEREGYATQCPKQISPIQHHSHAQLYQLQRDQALDMQSKISSSQFPTVAVGNDNQSSVSPNSRRLNSRYDNAVEVSGLALNVRRQTSPDRYSQNTVSPSPSNNIMMGQDGRLVLIANQQAHIVENSYDHDQATRLIEDNSPSPPQTNSCRKVLNPYMPTSADNSIHQVSSINTRGCSPAQIKLEPVRIVPTTGFDQQQRIDHHQQYNGQNEDSNQSPLKQYNNYQKQSSSPLKQLSTASPSPCKQSPIPARQNNIIGNLQINTITEESPDTGNPLVAQSIYENLRRMDMETIATRKSNQQVVMARDEDETISASDVSVALDTTEKKLDLQQRPKSSQLTARRRRDQRKTPTGRNTANALAQLSKSKDEKQGAGKRTKNKSNNVTQTTQNGHQRSKNNESSQSPRRQRSTSSVGRRSSNAGVKRNSTVNQSCPISMKEQMRLANLQRAKQYGNRCSFQNKSGLTKGTSPSKKQGESETSEGRSYSPLRPEILSACDLSVSVNIQPKEVIVHEKASVERKQKVRSSVSRNSHNSSVQRRSKHEVKMSGPAQRAKAEFLQKHNCAKKIQKNFRGYLDKQAQIEEELAREAERHAHMVFIHTEAGKVQRAFKAYMTRIGVMRAMQQRKRLKIIVNDLVTAWKTRRSLNCLGSEVQEFVNCENDRQRIELRNNFHVLFAKVIKNKLYLEDNYEKLQKIRQQIAAKMQQAKVKKQIGGPSNCANRANKRQVQQPVGQNDSPFKKTRQVSPEKIASPIKSKQNKQSSSIQRHTAQQHRNSQHARNNSSRQLSKNHRNSSASLGSVKEMDHAVANVRNSFDNQAMHELRNFIQNSDKKNESYCSIQFTSGPTPQTGENPKNKASHRNFSQNNENSQVLIQVHNKSLMDMISPQNNTRSSEQRPVNIMLGSCTRFSQKKFASGASIEERPEPPTATISKWNHGPSAERKQSQDSGCEYKQNLKKVRARVDCWNRSANQGETTPNDRMHHQTIDQQSSTVNRREQQIQNNKNAEKRVDSGMKTPVQAQHGRQMTGISFGSFNNSTNLANNHSRNKQPLDSRSKSTTQINQNKNQQQNQRQQHHQTMHNNQTTPLVRRKSMLREPTKFAQEDPKTNHKATIDIRRIGDMRQSPAIINQSRSTTPTVAGASSRLEQLARPKSSQMVSSTKNNQAAAVSSAATFQTATATTSKSFGKSATERSGYENHQTIAQQPLSRNRQTIKSSMTQQPMPNMQTQIFTMRETILNLTSAMEAIASEADANQRQLLKSQNTSGYGLNSQHRAAIKSIQAQEKTFSGLLATVQEQFQAFRDQAVPSHPSQNSDLV